MNKLIKLILNSRLLFLDQNEHQETDASEIQRYVLRVLLISFVIIAMVAQILIFVYVGIEDSNGNLHLILSPTIGLLFFLILLKLTTVNKTRMAAFLFLLILYLLIFRASVLAGIDNPQIVVMYSLIIIMSGIIISPKFSLVSTLIICSSLLILFLLHQNNVIAFNHDWRKNVFGIADALVLMTSYLIIAIVSWLFSNEIISSLRKIRKSEKKALKLAKELQKEKRSLEIKVKKRTKELREIQLMELTKISNLAEFGKLSAGLLHDIKNPLTVISLNLDSLRNSPRDKMMELINRSLLAAKTAETIIKTSQKQITNNENEQEFDLIQEIKNIIILTKHRAEREKVRIIINSPKTLIINGCPARLSRVVANLVMNAIDSFNNIKRSDRTILIKVVNDEKNVTITVRDNGGGIRDEDKSSLFQPLFSKKNDKDRMGLGLYVSKTIVKDCFGGNIFCESTFGKGTKFSVIIPKND